MAHIDLDRGVHQRQHPATGIAVYMYVDTPGVYLNAYGSEVSPELALEAGFDVDKLAKMRLRQERIKAARDQIEAEIDALDDGDTKIVRERDGFTIVDIGLGRYIIKDPDGNALISQPQSRAIADALIEKLSPNGKDGKVVKGKVVGAE